MCEKDFEFVFENKSHLKLYQLSGDSLEKIVTSTTSEDCTLEMFCNNTWIDLGRSDVPLYIGYAYRVKRKIVATPLGIPWEHVKENFKYAAMDKSGDVYVFEKEPKINRIVNVVWSAVEPGTSYTLNMLNINTDGIDWKRSLTKRPEGV